MNLNGLCSTGTMTGFDPATTICWEGKTSCHQGLSTQCMSLVQLSVRMLLLWSSFWHCHYLFILWDPVSPSECCCVLHTRAASRRHCDQSWGARWPQGLISEGQCSAGQCRFGCRERSTEVAISLVLFGIDSIYFRLQSRSIF